MTCTVYTIHHGCRKLVVSVDSTPTRRQLWLEPGLNPPHDFQYRFCGRIRAIVFFNHGLGGPDPQRTADEGRLSLMFSYKNYKISEILKFSILVKHPKIRFLDFWYHPAQTGRGRVGFEKNNNLRP